MEQKTLQKQRKWSLSVEYFGSVNNDHICQCITMTLRKNNEQVDVEIN